MEGRSLGEAGGQAAIRMDEAAVRYCTSPPPPPMLSPAALRAAGACPSTDGGRSSWFDTGVGLGLGLPQAAPGSCALVRPRARCGRRPWTSSGSVRA